MRRVGSGLAVGLTAVLSIACRDLSGFSTNGGSFIGSVVDADFVRAGVPTNTRMCLTLDANRFQDPNGPGNVSTDDGRFVSVPFRPIPQIWSDPLSTLSFGEGRLKNFIYVLGATTPFGDGNGNDVFAVLSLMQAGGVEVRLLRGAPSVGAALASDAGIVGAALASDAGIVGDGGTPGVDAGALGDAGANSGGSIFAIFSLARQSTPCSF